VPEAFAVCLRPSESLAVHWLALAPTPRLGPTRARRLVEHFGGVQNVFKASLTELEAPASRSFRPNRWAPASPWSLLMTSWEK
jgi:predicted Rossmann fold nucleotide-binding protein DprA/Smf involved in DNA uptake